MLSEAIVFFFYLEGKLTGVAHDQNGARLWLLLELVQSGQHEDRGLAHAALGLAEDVNTEDCLRDALLLHL